MGTPPTLLSRFEGCLFGLAVGDALGAPFEGMPADAIWYQFHGTHNIVSHPPVDQLIYTDDTQMMIGVAEALILDGRIQQQTLTRNFALNYQPDRGYGPGARKILSAVAAGEPADDLANTIFPGGSLGNGAAMRVAPIGLLFHDDYDRLLLEAEQSALPTHRHPVGIDGARILALAIAYVVNAADLERFDRAEFYDFLLKRANTEEFRHQLSRAAVLRPDDSIAPLGHSLEAHLSVVTAIAAFTESIDSYPDTVASAISIGGDTDTLAAMAGALAGAHLGENCIPPHLLDLLEEGPKGKTYIRDLAQSLYSMHEQLIT